jgi:hypothetical protein
VKQVWKFELDPNSVLDGQHEIVIMVPAGTEPRCIMSQGAGVYLWAEVPLSGPANQPPKLVPYKILCIGTGHGTVPDGAAYFGSVIHHHFVWHFYLTAPYAKATR